ncbi:hypothetical protein KIPB_007008, partial [Kipferlia bialata]|eukprot:g3732.t1
MAKAKTAQHPDKPKRPASAYILYMKDERENVKNNHPDLPPKEIIRVVAQQYKALSEAEMKPYVDAYERAKEDYDIAMEEFFVKHPEERGAKGAGGAKKGAAKKGKEDGDDKPKKGRAPTAFILFSQACRNKYKKKHGKSLGFKE